MGKAIRDSGIPRNEFFVTTKLSNSDHDNVEEALNASLAALGLDYVDLYLMHWPMARCNGEPRYLYMRLTCIAYQGELCSLTSIPQ